MKTFGNLEWVLIVTILYLLYKLIYELIWIRFYAFLLRVNTDKKPEKTTDYINNEVE